MSKPRKPHSRARGPFLAATLALTLLACSSLGELGDLISLAGGGGQPQAAAAAVGPAGGTLNSSDGGLQLDVPAGALTEPTEIRVALIDSDRSTDLLTYDLSPDGLQFQAPVTVIVSYKDALLADSDATSLRLVHVTDEGEQQIADQTLDAQNQRISGSIDHFSQVALRLEESTIAATGLSGSDQKTTELQGLHAEYHVSLLYEPAANTWELFVMVEQEGSRGLYYELFSEGNIKVPHSGDLLTEGTVMLHGECLFEYGGQASRSSFQGVAAPFQILSEAAPGEGDTVRVIINPESLELYAVEDDDALGEEGAGLACPAFGPREAFELTLEEALPVVPLD